METAGFFDSSVFSLVVLPILIFLARVTDVTLGTIRIIYVTRGRKYLAPIFAFFEILIWLLAIRQIMQNLNNPYYYLAFAGGFTLGNFIGIIIEDMMAIGMLVVRVITRMEATDLVNFLKAEGYGVTSVDAQGATGPVKLVYTIIKRKDLSSVIAIIRRFNPKAFFSIEEIRSAREGIFPAEKGQMTRRHFRLFKLGRKGK